MTGAGGGGAKGLEGLPGGAWGAGEPARRDGAPPRRHVVTPGPVGLRLGLRHPSVSDHANWARRGARRGRLPAPPIAPARTHTAKKRFVTSTENYLT